MVWVASFALALMAGCGDDGAATVRLFDRDNGAKPELAVGDTLIVTLGSNASTGFSWMINIESPRLELRQQRYESPTTSLVGAPGTQIFEFEAVSAGSGPPLQLAYRRSTGPPDQLWEITPIVR